MRKLSLELGLSLSALLLASCQGVQNPASKAPSEPVQMTEAEISALHGRMLTLDTHVDIPLTYMIDVDPGRMTDAQVDLPKMEAGGLDAAFFIVYIPQTRVSADGYKGARKIAEIRYTAIDKMLKTYPERIELARTAADVRRIVEEGKRAALIGMENAYPLGDNLDDVQLWADRGVSYVGITHMGHNQFGDSSNPKIQWSEPLAQYGGLSDLGRQLIPALNDAGIMVDISHTAKSTMMEATKLSRVPVIASHSGVLGVADSLRNLDDEQLRALADNGGVVQLVALGAYVKALTPKQKAFKAQVRKNLGVETDKKLWAMSPEKESVYRRDMKPMYEISPPAAISDYVDHIDYAVKVAGIDHVGISSDFDGGGGITGWQDAAETANVTAELVARGYSEEDIAKIWGENLLRVMDAAAKGAKQPENL